MIRSLEPSAWLERAAPLIERAGSVVERAAPFLERAIAFLTAAVTAVVLHAGRLARATIDRAFAEPLLAGAVITLIGCIPIGFLVMRRLRAHRRMPMTDPRRRVHSARALLDGGACLRDVVRRTGLSYDAATLLHLTAQPAASAGMRKTMPAGACMGTPPQSRLSLEAATLYASVRDGTTVARQSRRTIRQGGAWR